MRGGSHTPFSSVPRTGNLTAFSGWSEHVSEKTLVIVDLDGTLADGNHRLHHIHPKETRNWDKFYEECSLDTPHTDVIELVRALRDYGMTVIILTGRREETRKETQQWLAHYGIPYEILIMRPKGNHEDDHKWKPGVLATLGGPANVLMVIEDRNRIVVTLREQGYRVLQVADGDF